MFSFFKKKNMSPEEFGAGLFRIVAPRARGIGDKEVRTLEATSVGEANLIRFELCALRAFAAEHLADQRLDQAAADRAKEALWLFLRETAPWGVGDFGRFRTHVTCYFEVDLAFRGLPEDTTDVGREAGKVFAASCYRKLDPMAVLVGTKHYSMAYKNGVSFLKAVRIVDRENARQAIDYQKEQQRKSPRLGTSNRGRLRMSWWSRLSSLFGQKKLAPSEVAAGIYGAWMRVHDDQDALTVLEPHATDIQRIRNELGCLRIFAGLHATRSIESKEEVHDVFWLFLAEMSKAPLSQGDLAWFKRNQGDYETVAFMGVPDGRPLFSEVGKVFACRIGRPMDPIAATAGALHFAISYEVVSKFVRSVRVVAKVRESNAVASIREQQRKRWM